MKNLITKSFSLILIISSTLLLDSCYDPCKGVSCLHGTCGDLGTCECELGWEGDDCSKAYNAKTVGNYALREVCWPSGEFIDTVVLVPSPNSLVRFKYTGLWNDHIAEIDCEILEGGREFKFDSTYLPSEDRWANFGTGVISEDGSSIHLDYQIFYPGDTVGPDDDCDAVLLRL